jgi:hypothetical protein
MVESLMALWLAGGERCEDLQRLREDEALSQLLGYALPSANAAQQALLCLLRTKIRSLQVALSGD